MLGLQVLQSEQSKRLLTSVETDDCAADGIVVATNCWVGHRTLCLEDFGKVAAPFWDCQTQAAIRIAPRNGIRQLAQEYAPEARGRWQAQ